MPKIFISYRREDTPYETTMIFDNLQAKFGREHVFMDVDTVPAGVDFRQHLHEAVERCDAILVVIGRGWLDACDTEGNKRLDDPRDFVRIEVEAALQRGVRTIPVLVRGASVPRPNDLPQSLQELAFRNALEVRAGRDFRNDIGRLIHELESVVVPKKPPSGKQTSTPEVLGGTETPLRERAMPAASAVEKPPVPVDGPIGDVDKRIEYWTNSIGMQFALIPAGEFLMGSPDSDETAHPNEKPQHRVKITEPFSLGVYAVTQEEYERVMGTNPSKFKNVGGRVPVEDVSWEEAQDFCRRLSGLPEEQAVGRRYRLPTEAEWEYACRAGSTTRYCFGDSEATLREYAWFWENAGKTTHPVGEKKRNAWGLYDMYGNVWEWCQYWYGAAYYASSPLDDPEGPTGGSRRVARGGSWEDAARFCRSAFRHYYSPGRRDKFLGFRVASVPVDAGK